MSPISLHDPSTPFIGTEENPATNIDNLKNVKVSGYMRLRYIHSLLT